MGSSDNSTRTLYLALQSTGILELTFDLDGGIDDSLAVVRHIEAGTKPGYIALHGDKLYSISRTNSDEPTSGEIFAFDIKPSGFSKLQQISANGEGGVHLEASPDGPILATATITGNTLSFYKIVEDGRINLFQLIQYNEIEDPGVIAAPHQVAFDSTGRYVFAPLRTLDRIDIYQVAMESITKVQSVKLPKSSGPRHVALRSGGSHLTYMYVACEKENSLRVFSVRHEDSREPILEPLQVLSVLGKDHAFTEPLYQDMAGAIALSGDGNFLYISNRTRDPSKQDTLAIFAIRQDGRATFLERQSVEGLHPRMFALSPDPQNKYIAICNQFDQTITIFERDAIRGLLGDLKGRLRVSPSALRGEPEPPLDLDHMRQNQKQGPMCVQWRAQS